MPSHEGKDLAAINHLAVRQFLAAILSRLQCGRLDITLG
jgi:hypothetical protein